MRLAEQFATWVECERQAEAIVQVREIVLRLARDRGEFDLFLASDAIKLDNVGASCQRLADMLGHEEFPLNVTAKRNLFRDTLTIVQELSAILGRVRAKNDLEER